jgi:thiamine biosynthesis lipoprotein
VVRSQPRCKSHPIGWLFCFLLVVPLLACSADPAPVVLRGSTMGTQWSVTYQIAPATPAAGAVQQLLESTLEQVNASMSTYRPDSEISAFNALPVGAFHAMSPAFAEVLATAQRVHRASQGALDPTVGPLVDLWGFGPEPRQDAVPGTSELDAARARVGLDKLLHDESEGLLHKRLDQRLDFSAIAKGYGVDRLAEQLEQLGVRNYLVDIGGELRVLGQHPRGRPWRVAIESPDGASRAPARLLQPAAGAIATSGDYRNFFTLDGQRFSHVIDPETGYPVRHELVSVTVLAETAMLADAWATALLVLGPVRAREAAERERLAVHLIWRGESESEQGWNHWSSPAIQPYLIEP